MTLYIIIAALSAVCVSLTVYILRLRSDISRLSSCIEKYIGKGENTPFSVSDNSFSRLHNNVCELERVADTERTNRIAENRQNADFVADVSHQLKTPVAGLRLYCEMQEAENPSEYGKKELELVGKMENLVRELLVLEKIQTNVSEMEFSENSVKDILCSAADEYRPLFPQKTITVSGDAILRCDRYRIGEAVGNALKNACEHTEPDGRITLSSEQNDSCVIITVEDDGGGVPDEEIPRLFRRFCKTANSSPSSTGLGLAICKAVVEKHHGSCFAENGKDGLKITICIPVIEGAEKL